MIQNINLLPYRESYFKRKVYWFWGVCSFSVFISFFISFIFFAVIRSVLQGYSDENNLVKLAMAYSDSKNKNEFSVQDALKFFSEEKSSLENIFADRKLSFQLLHELPLVIPENIYITSVLYRKAISAVSDKGVAEKNISMKDILIDISGKAASLSAIHEMMLRIERSRFFVVEKFQEFSDPSFGATKGRDLNAFVLVVRIKGNNLK